MKRTSVLTVIAVLFCSVLVSAKEINFENPKTSISEQLQEILSENSIDVDDKDVMARVLFKINQAGKIEVLDIVSERKDVKWFLSRKLSGKKIAVDNVSFEDVAKKLMPW